MPDFTRLSVLTFILYAIVALHLSALAYSWYFTIWWYDILLHFLGGLWVSGMALWFFREKRGHTLPRMLPIYAIAIGAVLVLGVLWEVFEFSLDTFIVFRTNDILDTLSDLGMDIAGALTTATLVARARVRAFQLSSYE